MGFFARLFGTEQALSQIVTGATSALDALAYTDEERAQDAAVERKEARKYVVEWMQATKGQNLTRRFIALLIVGMYGLMSIAAVGMSIAAVWVEPGAAAQLHASAAILKEQLLATWDIVLLVIGFYFAAPHLDKFAGVITARRRPG